MNQYYNTLENMGKKEIQGLLDTCITKKRTFGKDWIINTS